MARAIAPHRRRGATPWSVALGTPSVGAAGTRASDAQLLWVPPLFDERSRAPAARPAHARAARQRSRHSTPADWRGGGPTAGPPSRARWRQPSRPASLAPDVAAPGERGHRTVGELPVGARAQRERRQRIDRPAPHSRVRNHRPEAALRDPRRFNATSGQPSERPSSWEPPGSGSRSWHVAQRSSSRSSSSWRPARPATARTRTTARSSCTSCPAR